MAASGLLMRRLRLALGCALMLCAGAAAAQDFRDPAAQRFVVWPNIPVIRAADLADYAQDRQAFADLHSGKGDPAKVEAALQAVDNLQAHHQQAALGDLGRSLNVQFIAELDALARQRGVAHPRLRFDFADITPQQLQRPIVLDELKKQADHVQLAAYITYTRLDGTLVQATVTLVKLGSGASQSFSATVPVNALAQALAREVFDYFEGARFAPHRRPAMAGEWIAPAPGHADRLVSRDVALRYCASQGAELPTAQELEAGEAAGFYGGGVALRSGGIYHVQGGLYDTALAQDGDSRMRPNFIASVPNGLYYCVRHAASAQAARAAARAKARR